MYLVLQLSVCLCSSFPRESGTTKGWAKKPGPQAEGHNQTSEHWPTWPRPEQSQPATAMPESWHGSMGHAARGDQVGGGQGRVQLLRVHRAQPFPWPGILKEVVFQGLTPVALLFLPCLQHFWITVNSSVFAPSAAPSESKVDINIKEIFNWC